MIEDKTRNLVAELLGIKADAVKEKTIVIANRLLDKFGELDKFKIKILNNIQLQKNKEVIVETKNREEPETETNTETETEEKKETLVKKIKKSLQKDKK